MQDVRLVLAAAPVALLLTGCVAHVDGIVGLQRVGSHVHAVVQMCGGRSVDTISLDEVKGTFADEWQFDEPVTDMDAIDIGVFDDSVTLLDTGHAFELKASSSTGDGAINGPQFVADDLAKLNDGETLTAAGTFNEDGFAQMVSSYCG